MPFGTLGVHDGNHRRSGLRGLPQEAVASGSKPFASARGMRRCCPSREAAERDQPRAPALGLISIGKDKPVAAAERFNLPPLWGCDIDEQESPSAYALGYFLTPLRGSGQHARIMLQKIRVPSGFVLATAVLYFAEPTGASILLGLPVALIG